MPIQNERSREEMLEWFIHLSEANLRYNQWTFTLILIGTILFVFIMMGALYLAYRVKRAIRESAAAARASALAAKEHSELARLYMGRFGQNTQEAKDKVHEVAEKVERIETAIAEAKQVGGSGTSSVNLGG